MNSWTEWIGIDGRTTRRFCVWPAKISGVKSFIVS
jgi:hypothetical protein